MSENQSRTEVDQFLWDHIDTVPHLEALLLLWNSRPKTWSIEHVARGLFVERDAAKAILDDLVRESLIAAIPNAAVYGYEPHPDRDRLIDAVDATYRRELIRVSGLIHSKPSAAVRAFAQAFQLKRDRE